MNTTHIYYKSGYKHQLSEDYYFEFDVTLLNDTPLPAFIDAAFGEGSYLVGKAGYAFDGVTGMIDTPDLMRAAAEHDITYQLIRYGCLPKSYWKEADKQFRITAKEDRVWAIRRWMALRGLKVAQGKFADPKQKKKVHIAPRIK